MVWEKKKKRKNYANRFSAILSVALIVNLGLYRLPDSIFGLKIKKVDLLSDIRKPIEGDTDNVPVILTDDENAYLSVTSGNQDIMPTADIPVSPAIQPSVPPEAQPPLLSPGSTDEQSPGSSDHQATNDTVTDVFDRETNINQQNTSSNASGNDNNTDYLSNTQIEDFSPDHTGLSRFFSALNRVNHLGRPVRIAFLGDSFIEGDILVADFRAKMQERFGGRGVGFIPITSNVAQYRPTIKQSADGWETYSIIKNRNIKYVLSGLIFEPKSNKASIRFQTVDIYPELEEVSSIKFIYSNNKNTGLLLKSDTDTSYHELPPTESVTQYEIKGKFTKGSMHFRNIAGLKAIGVAFEDNRGVVVDNFSLRGNSGIILSELDDESCRELQRIRPYDLIVMQYGLNVASDSIRGYGWYRNRMVSVIEHMQYCFPGADILILGVSDRSHKNNGAYSTMPAVLSLLRAQRQTARETEVTFWSIFAAMGGRNSMIKYVNSNWASKDYTHLSFRGGKEIARALFDAIITEKDFYDDDERFVE
ncbi:MAG: hypothetical protein LBC19_10540 [Tannerella sp.]|jgi:hypothetical protein|nr:hypothetical protein [Tannerella sp.]